MSDITIANTRPEHLAALAAHQRICFPTLAPYEWMAEEHFASHLRLFPEGQHVALDGERVVGQSSTFRISGARALNQHQYMDILGQSYFTNHDPDGEWLYGADMSVHPDYRGRGLGADLYGRFFAAVRARGCTSAHCITAPINTGSIAFHMRMGFLPEPGDAEANGVRFKRDYDGPGQDRVSFVKQLS